MCGPGFGVTLKRPKTKEVEIMGAQKDIRTELTSLMITQPR